MYIINAFLLINIIINFFNIIILTLLLLMLRPNLESFL